jgi:hypothetical protein
VGRGGVGSERLLVVALTVAISVAVVLAVVVLAVLPHQRALRKLGGRCEPHLSQGLVTLAVGQRFFLNSSVGFVFRVLRVLKVRRHGVAFLLLAWGGKVW